MMQRSQPGERAECPHCKRHMCLRAITGTCKPVPPLGKAPVTIEGLARARYPDVPPDIAVRYFRSDRRRAGLGALGAGRGPLPSRQVSQYKASNGFDGMVFYRISRDYPSRDEYDLPPIGRVPCFGHSAELTIKTVRIPASHRALVLPVPLQDFAEQMGRIKVAHLLRNMRNEIRTATQSKDAKNV